MDSRSALLTQLESLLQQILRVEKAVQSPRLDVNLRERVGARFDKLLSQQRNQLTLLKQDLSNNQPLKACWQQLSQHELNCRELFEECLAFIQGALARADAVDEGMCFLADNLLDDLAAWSDVRWRRFTLLSTGEFYQDTAELIRIRFPEVSFWELPIVAHEFGHFLGPELRENQNGEFRYPFQEMLKKADENRLPRWPLPHSKEWYYLQEHFADLFATYTLGPAFASSFILLRLNPVDAYNNSITHPRHAERVHAIFWMLDRMDQADGGFLRPYRALINVLQSRWQQGLQDVDQPNGLPHAEIAGLELKLRDLDNLITRTTPTRLAYRISDWQNSQTITTRLLSDLWTPSDQVNSEVSRRDVLNAAWLSRLQLKDSNQDYVNVRDISSRALEMYRRIQSHQ